MRKQSVACMGDNRGDNVTDNAPFVYGSRAKPHVTMRTLCRSVIINWQVIKCLNCWEKQMQTGMKLGNVNSCQVKKNGIWIYEELIARSFGSISLCQNHGKIMKKVGYQIITHQIVTNRIWFWACKLLRVFSFSKNATYMNTQCRVLPGITSWPEVYITFSSFFIFLSSLCLSSSLAPKPTSKNTYIHNHHF